MKKVLFLPSCFFFSVVAPLYLEELDGFTPDTILMIQDFDLDAQGTTSQP
jgi:hypothetical protein